MEVRAASTHIAQSDCCCCQTYQTAITGVRLVNSICIFVTELINDLPYSVVILGCQAFSNEFLKSWSVSAKLVKSPREVHSLESPLFPLVVDFIVEQTLDIDVHFGRWN